VRVHWLQHVPFEGLGSIASWLEDRDARVTSTRFYAGESVPGVNDLDLVIAMGGPMSVNDDKHFRWLVDERRFIRQAIDGNVAILGVCLGAQLIAQALGARVYENTEREVGWWPVTGVSDERDVPSWARKNVASDVYHWHGETFDLPNGAVKLAQSAGCANQAFRFGRRVIGIQFHLETTPALVQALVTNCPEDLAPGTFVQSDQKSGSMEVNRFASLRGLMRETLDYVWSPGAIVTQHPKAETMRADAEVRS
jgi:GMP synthase-like glutamine amidotransferase